MDEEASAGGDVEGTLTGGVGGVQRREAPRPHHQTGRHHGQVMTQGEVK